MNFWRKIDSRGPYKNGENFSTISKCAKKIILWQNSLFHSSKEVFLQTFRQFLENWIFDGKSTALQTLQNWWKFCTISKCAKKTFFWQNSLFHSAKEVFLQTFRQFLENWIFDGKSTAADLTKMVKILYYLKCAKNFFSGKILCSTHQKKCFYKLLGSFWKIEFLTENRQPRTLQNMVKILYYLKMC